MRDDDISFTLAPGEVYLKAELFRVYGLDGVKEIVKWVTGSSDTLIFAVNKDQTVKKMWPPDKELDEDG